MPDTEKLKVQERLKAELSTDAQGHNLEKLAAALVGRMLGVTVSVARSSFQYGADAGPAGRQGRRLRIEAKRYGATTALDERELRGGRCFRAVDSMSDEEPKLIAIDEEANHQIVHDDRFGKANGATYKPFNPGPQIDVLAFDFLRIRLPNVMLLWVDMPLVRPPIHRCKIV